MIKVFPVSILLLLGGCALPLPIQIASWVADGFSYIATDKSIADHGISMVMNRDCSLLHIITKGEICSDEDYIGFAAVFRDFNEVKSPAPTLAATPVPSVALAANDNMVEIASNDNVNMDLAGFVTASGLLDGKTKPVMKCVAKWDVNIRAEPRGAADIRKVLLRNESVKCLDEKGGWRMVELAVITDGDARYGWIDGKYLELL